MNKFQIIPKIIKTDGKKIITYRHDFTPISHCYCGIVTLTVYYMVMLLLAFHTAYGNLIHMVPVMMKG